MRRVVAKVIIEVSFSSYLLQHLQRLTKETGKLVAPEQVVHELVEQYRKGIAQTSSTFIGPLMQLDRDVRVKVYGEVLCANC
jgi:hypothetical protein